MTEDEAKTKWCPFARHANGSGGVGVNRVNWDREYPYANCIASACMAWRWSSAPIQVIGNDATGALTREDLPGGGYCGLAGRPD